SRPATLIRRARRRVSSAPISARTGYVTKTPSHALTARDHRYAQTLVHEPGLTLRFATLFSVRPNRPNWAERKGHNRRAKAWLSARQPTQHLHRLVWYLAFCCPNPTARLS